MYISAIHPDEVALLAVEVLARRGVGEGHLLVEGEACQRGCANVWERAGNILPVIRDVCTVIRTLAER